MTNNIAKIRAALEYAMSAARLLVLPGLHRDAEAGLAALAELERAAAEPVAWRYRYVDGKHGSAWLTNSNPPPKGDAAVADVELLYAAPPAKPAMGIFTAEEVEVSYIEGHDAAKYDTYTDRCASVAAEQFPYSDTFKLIQERTK